MSIVNKIRKSLVCSTCNNTVSFLFIENVECDYGMHTLIQCPECQELFSIDGPCNAFTSLLTLTEVNPQLLSENDIHTYRLSAHFCNLD